MKNETLISWTSHVFSLIKEPAHTEGNRQFCEEEEGAYLVNAVDGEKYLNLLKQYASCAAQTMGNQAAWIDDKVPQQSFFDFDTFLQSAEADCIGWNEQKKLEVLEVEHLYVQKAIIPEGSQVCFFGDYHGSIHSCLRNLWRLVAQGYLDTDFRIIKDNFYIVTLGDYVDRGWFGLEVVYTLLLLKLAPGNWDKVFLLKGNHETINQSAWETSSYGLTFFAELACKFGTTKGALWSGKKCKTITIEKETKELSDVLLLSTLKWYTFLPLALFVQNGNGEYIQCSHGGVARGYDFALLKQGKEKKFQELKGLNMPSSGRKSEYEWSVHTGFNWSDFSQKSKAQEERADYISSQRGCGIMPSAQWTEKYLAENPFLKGFFRGHQDLFFGFKMLFKSKDRPTKEEFEKCVKALEKKETFKDIMLGLWQIRAEEGIAPLKKKLNCKSAEWWGGRTKKENQLMLERELRRAYDKEYKDALVSK